MKTTAQLSPETQQTTSGGAQTGGEEGEEGVTDSELDDIQEP